MRESAPLFIEHLSPRYPPSLYDDPGEPGDPPDVQIPSETQAPDAALCAVVRMCAGGGTSALKI